MVWKLVATTALWGAFPKYKVVVLAGSAALSAVQRARAKREKKRTSWDESTSLEAGAGALEAEGMEWSDVRCELLRQDGTVDKEILRGINGRTGAGRLTCLMGPSGSGKTTLLSILARQMPSNKRMRLVGKYYIGGHTAEYSRLKTAFVQQEDLFYSQLTVRETLRMSAKLRGQDESAVEEIIKTLGLVNCADTVVGDSKTRGISGGEKKRLSIGVELLGNPSIIFLDEPTTGLDSFQAESVVSTLRELADAGHTVICSIHQPKSAIFSKFDDMVLLAEGMCIYSGPLEDAEAYFSAQGHACPNLCNPAEHFIDLVSMDYSSDEQREKTQSRILKLAAAWRSTYNLKRKPLHSTKDLKKDAELVSKLVPTKRGGILTQVRLLLARSWRQIRRDKATNLVRLNTSLFSALLFGSIFYKLPFTQVSIQDRMGLLQVSCINAAMTALTKTLNAFPKEATIVGRERAKKLYNVGPYFASKLLAELPISAVFPAVFGAVIYPMAGLNKDFSRFLQFLGIVTLESFTSASLGLAVGSVAPSTEAAMAIGPSVMVLFIVFGGYYVNSETPPKLFSWIPKVSLIKHGFEAACINEFSGLKFDVKEDGDLATGRQVLDRLGFKEDSLRSAVLWQSRILIFNYLFTYQVLKNRRPKFQRLEDPTPKTSVVESLRDADEASSIPSEVEEAFKPNTKPDNNEAPIKRKKHEKVN